MSDDSFFREVNEEIRQEQARALWDRFGPIILVLAALVVLATAGYVGWQYWRETRAGSAGDAFQQALQLAKDGKNDEALAALKAIEDDGHGAYPVLARMRAAGVMAETGDAAGALAAFDAIAADSRADISLRDISKLRAALLLVDTGSYGDVAQRAEALAQQTNPLRNSAREALGLAAWKEGNAADANKFFEDIAADIAASDSQKQRANLMLELMRSSGTGS